MGNKVKVIRGILFKAIGFFVAGVLVSMALLADTDTLAWFSSRVTGGLQVQAASAEDIIDDFYTLSDGPENNINPHMIVVKKAGGLTYDPAVYFSVDGDISRYIMHINPVKLTQDEMQIPIRIKINYRDLGDILSKSSITGKITLKYLNEFIIDSFQITFTRGYLLTQYLGLQDRQLIAKFNSNFDVDKELTPYIAQIINDIAGNIRWEDVMGSGRIQKLEKASGPNENVDDEASGSAFSITPATMNRARMIEPVENIMSKIQLTDEQQSIIDVVAPGLRKYIDALYGYIEDLIAQLNEKLAKIDELNLTIDGMNTQIQGLNAAIDDMTQKYADLEREKVALLQEKLDLEQENANLNDKIDDLEDEIDSLESKNDSLRDKNASLSEKVQKLQEENDSLKQEIEELKHSAPSGGGSKDTAPGGSGEPSGGNEPPAETPPPAVESPDEVSGESDTEQPPAEDSTEEDSDMGSPDNGGTPPSDQQPPTGDSTEEDPAVESPGNGGTLDSTDGLPKSGDADIEPGEATSDTDPQEEQPQDEQPQTEQPPTQQAHQDVLIAP